MAVEAEAGAYLNKPYLYQLGVFFSHNPLHDLESLWWVGLWFLLCHYKPPKTGTVPKHIKVVKKFSESLFNNLSDALSRRHTLTGSTLFANTKPSSFPDGVKYFIVILEMYREQLVGCYESYKPKATQDRSFFIPNVHGKFGDEIGSASCRERVLVAV